MKNLEILLVLIVVILSSILSYKWSGLNKTQKIIFLTIIFFSAIIAFIQFKTNRKETQEKELKEKIDSEFGEIKVDGQRITAFALGNCENPGIFQSVENNFEMEPLVSSLKLAIKNNKLVVNVLVRDLSGEIIAVIEDNTWTVFDDRYEYNNDQNSFELVTRGDRKVFFQLVYREELVRLSGYFLNNKGLGFVIYCNKEKEGGSLALPIKPNTTQKNLDEIEIPRIFKYPRKKYYGIKL